MNKHDLEQFIWQTRYDFLKYMTNQEWTVRCMAEAQILNEHAFKNIHKLGFETVADMIQEKNKLEKQLETLKETIKILSKGEIEE